MNVKHWIVAYLIPQPVFVLYKKIRYFKLPRKYKCKHCSRPKSLFPKLHKVYHQTKWCPEFPAIALVDNNESQIDEAGELIAWTIDKHISRPVFAGEIVFLLDENFASFGQVINTRPAEFSKKSKIIEFLVIGVGAGEGQWLYMESGWDDIYYRQKEERALE